MHVPVFVLNSGGNVGFPIFRVDREIITTINKKFENRTFDF